MAKSSLKEIDLCRSHAYTILDSLTAHVAIIDENGMILETNLAWKRFGLANEIQITSDTVGINYLEVCDQALGEDAQRSKKAAEGIRRVIHGDLNEFVMEYPCHGPTPDASLWFYMRATRANEANPIRVVISHEDITPLKLAEQALAENSRSLEEANAALKVLLRQRDEDKTQMEEAVFHNIRKDILPLLDQLESQKQTARGTELIDLIHTSLKEITSPLIRRLTRLETLITPGEIRIARLIKDGKSTKEMADLLNLSVTTISFHRRNLRKKLGLNNKNINLRTYLLSLSM